MSTESLEPGDLVRCPHCRRPHLVGSYHEQPSTAYANAMLYVRCGNGGLYYVGQRGYPSRHPVVEVSE